MVVRFPYICSFLPFKDNNKSSSSEVDHLLSLTLSSNWRGGSRVFAVQSISGVDTIPEPTDRSSGMLLSLWFRDWTSSPRSHKEWLKVHLQRFLPELYHNLYLGKKSEEFNGSKWRGYTDCKKYYFHGGEKFAELEKQTQKIPLQVNRWRIGHKAQRVYCGFSIWALSLIFKPTPHPSWMGIYSLFGMVITLPHRNSKEAEAS